MDVGLQFERYVYVFRIDVLHVLITSKTSHTYTIAVALVIRKCTLVVEVSISSSIIDHQTKQIK